MGWSMETSIRVMPWFLVVLGKHTAYRHLVLTHDNGNFYQTNSLWELLYGKTREDTSSVSKSSQKQ